MTMMNVKQHTAARADHENFLLDAFRDKVCQELRTAKHLHTCRERGEPRAAS
jgi:hypothetical protein